MFRILSFSVISSVIGAYSVDCVGEIIGSNSLVGEITILDSKGEQIENRENVVVFIDGLVDAEYIGNDTAPIQMSHLDRTFSPHVVPLMRGSSLDFFNDDNIFHNVFSVSRTQPFDLGIYPFGTSKVVQFNNPGLIKLYCNMHPSMVSNVLVLNNQFYSLTTGNGKYSIEGIPDGKFTVRVWHEFGDAVEEVIAFSGGQAEMANITITQSGKLQPHKNKFGRDYSSKY